MSRIAWVPGFGDSPDLYQQVEVPEPGDPGWPGADPAPEPPSRLRKPIVIQITVKMSIGK